ncbi:hypothetical protein RO3G_16481 [Rhizopus delemar RA 99-880]|uniref:Uncharacterized protein n=1 Tax=Rhizopus delemar (strain RA 99-880 / ATCC MYA-4621 / FGSC 9543 / NRRL 43880) TaxID=246409 RepID=I1CTJ0_RHIO9|nr:hypothetical protein RO3G_16481 [Rhizopus delemar RA 99-880]|eukprot:EIE91770.1 hypothetical protein RO3G_16481 [Rhizopus delemar RA 99-880]
MIELFVIARPLISMLVVDVGLSIAVYYITKMWVSQLIAIILSSIPPLLHTIYTFIRKRSVDILGCIFVLSSIISAILTAATEDIRISLLRDSITTATIGVVLFITLIPLKTRWFTIRPMLFTIIQEAFSKTAPFTWTDQEGLQHSVPVTDFKWDHISAFRKFCYVITFAWGVLLIGEFVAKVIMIGSILDVDQIVLYGNIIVIVIVIFMTSVTAVGFYFIQKRSMAFVTYLLSKIK